VPPATGLAFRIYFALGQNDGLFKQLKKALIERALGAELTDHLGYKKDGRSARGKGNSRNGTSSDPKPMVGEPAGRIPPVARLTCPPRSATESAMGVLFHQQHLGALPADVGDYPVELLHDDRGRPSEDSSRSSGDCARTDVTPRSSLLLLAARSCPAERIGGRSDLERYQHRVSVSARWQLWSPIPGRLAIGLIWFGATCRMAVSLAIQTPW
jgi:hypothetical protein